MVCAAAERCEQRAPAPAPPPAAPPHLLAEAGALGRQLRHLLLEPLHLARQVGGGGFHLALVVLEASQLLGGRGRVAAAAGGGMRSAAAICKHLFADRLQLAFKTGTTHSKECSEVRVLAVTGEEAAAAAAGAVWRVRAHLSDLSARSLRRLISRECCCSMLGVHGPHAAGQRGQGHR